MKSKIVLRNVFIWLSSFAILIFAGIGTDVSAQGKKGWPKYQKQIRKDQKKIDKEIRKAQKEYYRAYRNGVYYQTDYRGAQLLRQAVNEGYRQGYRQGVTDRRYGRNNGYYESSIYRIGTYGYRSYVDRGQYQYYFQQGFERGYYDGFNSASRYGYYSGGRWNILANVLGSILDIRRY